MNFTEQEIFEQIGRLFMANVALSQENQQLASALATAAEKEKNDGAA
jgi:hypothetical protein